MRTLALAWDGEAFWPLSADRTLARADLRPRRDRRLRRGEGPLLAQPPALLRLTARGLGELAEGYAERFATEEHLRKWALIHTGFARARSSSAAQGPRPDRSPPSSAPMTPMRSSLSKDARSGISPPCRSRSRRWIMRPSRRASGRCWSFSPTSSASSLPSSCSPAPRHDPLHQGRARAASVVRAMEDGKRQTPPPSGASRQDRSPRASANPASATTATSPGSAARPASPA